MGYFNSEERAKIWLDIYNENNNSVIDKLSKVFEVTSLLAALSCSIGSSFLVKKIETDIDYLRQFFSTISILLSLFTVCMSIIFIVMINVLKKDKIETFIRNNAFYFIFPTLGLISSIVTIIVSILFYHINIISYILMGIFFPLILFTIVFYCKLRNFVIT